MIVYFFLLLFFNHSILACFVVLDDNSKKHPKLFRSVFQCEKLFYYFNYRIYRVIYRPFPSSVGNLSYENEFCMQFHSHAN